MESIQEKLKAAWPDWEISEKIGEGAFGEVYRAVRRDLAGTTYAAIKAISIPGDDEELEELKAEGLSRDQSYAYFRQVVRDYTHEIQLMDSVKGYTNIVSIDDYKIVESQDPMRWHIFIRMELLTPLMKKAAIDELTEADVIQAGIDLCTALEVCRKKNIVHRDIKPQNIFVNSGGNYKLGDFGIARCLDRTTGNLSRKGAPNYMAPELYKAGLREIDYDEAAKVDIYSLGLVLYWMANRSRLPFLPQDKQLATPQDREAAFVRRISGEELPAPAQASPELCRIILKACAYKPEDRYASAGDMKKDLTALRDRPQEVGAPAAGKLSEEPAGRPEEPKKKKPRAPVLLILLAAVLVIGLAAVARYVIWPPEKTDTPAAVSEETALPEEAEPETAEPPSDRTAGTGEPAAEEPATEEQATEPPVTEAPVTEAPVTEAPVTEAPVTETPVIEEPAPEAEETGTATPETVPVPTLTSLYGGSVAKLHEFSAGGSSERITLYAGPGKEYGKFVRITPNGQRRVTAYFTENEWVFTHIYHQSTDLYIWVPQRYFDYLEDVPAAAEAGVLKGTVTGETVPRWGPGKEFAEEADCAAPEGTAVRAFFSSGDYIYCEYACGTGTVRMWLPSAALQITE